MGASRCAVEFRDGDHRTIEVEVHATSLYEAVVIALAASKAERKFTPGPSTEFRVTSDTTGEHTVTYRTIEEFLIPSTKGGPRAVGQRARLRAILDGRTPP
jgi:uncharacterized protein YndB with AHSA1/START domain